MRRSNGIRVPTVRNAQRPNMIPTDHNLRNGPETGSVYEDKRDDGKRLATVDTQNGLTTTTTTVTAANINEWRELRELKTYTGQ